MPIIVLRMIPGRPPRDYQDEIQVGVKRGLEGLYRDNGKENGSYYLGFRVLGLG